MTKRSNDGYLSRKEETQANINDVNDELKSVIEDYWKDKQKPGFTGYKPSGSDGGEEEVRSDDSSSRVSSSRHSRHGEGRKQKEPKKKGKGSKILKIILAVLLLCILIGGGTFAYMQHAGKKAASENEVSSEEIKTSDEAVTENGGKTVVYKGVTYNYNTDISTILFIGVDKHSYEQEDDVVYGNGGQADTIILAAINNKTGETSMIPISRNTITAIDEYNTDGTYWRQYETQLAFAYSYGDGKEESCENVAKAVSRLLYGMPVNQYVTINISSINALNNAIGGVEVQVIGDLSDVDPEMTEGNVLTLTGDQAETYVRHRKTTIEEGKENEVDNNAIRMERQKQYLSAFMNKALKQTKSNPLLPIHLYNEVSDDTITTLGPSQIVYYASLFVNKGFNNSIASIPGEIKHGKFTEVYPDQEALYQIVLDTFYERD